MASQPFTGINQNPLVFAQIRNGSTAVEENPAKVCVAPEKFVLHVKDFLQLFYQGSGSDYCHEFDKDRKFQVINYEKFKDHILVAAKKQSMQKYDVSIMPVYTVKDVITLSGNIWNFKPSVRVADFFANSLGVPIDCWTACSRMEISRELENADILKYELTSCDEDKEVCAMTAGELHNALNGFHSHSDKGKEVQLSILFENENPEIQSLDLRLTFVLVSDLIVDPEPPTPPSFIENIDIQSSTIEEPLSIKFQVTNNGDVNAPMNWKVSAYRDGVPAREVIIQEIEIDLAPGDTKNWYGGALEYGFIEGDEITLRLEDRNNPDIFKEESIIFPPSPPVFDIENINISSDTLGETWAIMFQVWNDDDVDGSMIWKIFKNGVLIKTLDVDLAVGESRKWEGGNSDYGFIEGDEITLRVEDLDDPDKFKEESIQFPPSPGFDIENITITSRPFDQAWAIIFEVMNDGPVPAEMTWKIFKNGGIFVQELPVDLGPGEMRIWGGGNEDFDFEKDDEITLRVEDSDDSGIFKEESILFPARPNFFENIDILSESINTDPRSIYFLVTNNGAADVPMILIILKNGIEIERREQGLMPGENKRWEGGTAAPYSFSGGDQITLRVEHPSYPDMFKQESITFPAAPDSPTTFNGDLSGEGYLNEIISGTIVAIDDDGARSAEPYTIGMTPSNGQAIVFEGSRGGKWEYRPEPDYVGSDLFSIEFHDARGGGDTAYINVNVLAPGDFDQLYFSAFYADFGTVQLPNNWFFDIYNNDVSRIDIDVSISVIPSIEYSEAHTPLPGNYVPLNVADNTALMFVDINSSPFSETETTYLADILTNRRHWIVTPISQRISLERAETYTWEIGDELIDGPLWQDLYTTYFPNIGDFDLTGGVPDGFFILIQARDVNSDKSYFNFIKTPITSQTDLDGIPMSLARNSNLTEFRKKRIAEIIKQRRTTPLKAIGPAWTTGDVEPPAGEKDMGGWTAAVYTEEQQQNLKIDEFGKPTGIDHNTFVVMNNGKLDYVKSKFPIKAVGKTRDFPPSTIIVSYGNCSVDYMLSKPLENNQAGYHYNNNVYIPVKESRHLLRYSKSGMLTMDFRPGRVTITGGGDSGQPYKLTFENKDN